MEFFYFLFFIFLFISEIFDVLMWETYRAIQITRRWGMKMTTKQLGSIGDWHYGTLYYAMAEI